MRRRRTLRPCHPEEEGLDFSVKITPQTEDIEIAKPKRRRRRYNLEQLVAGMSPQNRHRELEWGPPAVGNEVW
jgi:antitoxin component of MazEF toxin-antitoxin module